MPSLHSVALGCATVTALVLLGTRGAGVTAAADVQLRPSAAKELAAGKLLVAARGLRDPNFSETVILLAEHSAGERHGPGAQPPDRGLRGAPVPESPGGAGADGRGVPRRPGLARRGARAVALHDALSRQSARHGRRPRGHDAAGSRDADCRGGRSPSLPGVRRLRGLGPRSVGARDPAGLVARLHGRHGGSVRSGAGLAVATSAAPDRGANGPPSPSGFGAAGSPLPRALRRGRSAQRARPAGTRRASPLRSSSRPRRPAS